MTKWSDCVCPSEGKEKIKNKSPNPSLIASHVRGRGRQVRLALSGGSVPGLCSSGLGSGKEPMGWERRPVSYRAGEKPLAWQFPGRRRSNIQRWNYGMSQVLSSQVSANPLRL